jgi:transposase-like protein
MVDISAISGALSSLIAAKDIAQAMVGLHDAASFQGKLIEFQSKIIEAQSGAMAANDERTSLLETIRQLKKEMADLKAWEANKQRYELKKLGTGTFVYSLKPEAQGTEPAHWLCAKCFEDGKKSILQTAAVPAISSGTAGGQLYSCHSCNYKFVIPWEIIHAR